MKLSEIHAAVEAFAGDAVSLHSVHDVLRRSSVSSEALFERPQTGYYKLVRKRE